MISSWMKIFTMWNIFMLVSRNLCARSGAREISMTLIHFLWRSSYMIFSEEVFIRFDRFNDVRITGKVWQVSRVEMIWWRRKWGWFRVKTREGRFWRPFGHGYKYNCKNSSRNRMRTSDTALENWESIFFNEKIFNVLRTHPE